MNTRLPEILCACVIASPLIARGADEDRFSMEDYYKVDKVDAHFHLNTKDRNFVELAVEDRFRFVNIVVDSAGEIALRHRHQSTLALHAARPDRVAAASAFSLKGWDGPDWDAKTIRHLDATFAKGAVAVKIWKNIGMVFRDKDGELVMVDHPKFDPVFAHLQKEGIRVIGHLGEPKNCWLPLEQMTVNNDRNYFRKHAEYHMFKHPDMPSYEEQIAARDRMLEKNPKLHFIGAHFASLEWSTDELGKFLDRFPNASVDTAARIGQLQYQSERDREKVIAFLHKYQDRILYGTDFSMASDAKPEDAHARARKRWLADWKYFNTDAEMAVPELDDPVRGLALPKSVVEKIYHRNAVRLFPGSWKK